MLYAAGFVLSRVWLDGRSVTHLCQLISFYNLKQDTSWGEGGTKDIICKCKGTEHFLPFVDDSETGLNNRHVQKLQQPRARLHVAK